LEIARTVPDLVYALILVYAFGLGPLPGVFAIAVQSMEGLGKLFSEMNENTDMRPVEGVRAAGGNHPQIMRFAILPQVFAVMLSHALYYLESNTHSATILGVVGAGDIGLHLADRIRVNTWDEVSFILIMILVVVTVMDLRSKAYRLRLIRAAAPSSRRSWSAPRLRIRLKLHLAIRARLALSPCLACEMDRFQDRVRLDRLHALEGCLSGF
jgi:ABC-type phosphate/phosphonate transport system permease subunit